MKPTLRLTIVLSALVVLGACAGPNPVQDAPVPISEVSGFWFGLWNGLTLPISLIGSLITDYITIYAVQNTGGGYDIGYGLGILLLAGLIKAWLSD